MISRFAIFVAAMLLPSPVLFADIIIDFGTGTSPQNLPYSEDGFTFSNQLGNSRVLGTTLNTDRYLNLVAGATGPNVSVRLTGTMPFDLNSVNIRANAARTWRFDASNGSTLVLPHGFAAGTIDFTSLASDWTNLTFVDIKYDEGLANANLRLDNFDVSISAVPEPSSALLVAMTFLIAAGYRQRISRLNQIRANHPIHRSGGGQQI